MDKQDIQIVVLVAAVLGIMAAVSFAADPEPVMGGVAPWVQTIGTNAVKVCPARNVSDAATFATNTAYTQGAVTKTATAFYMAVNAGTSGTNSPHHTSGDVSDGTVTWRAFPAGPRNGIWLTNPSGEGTNVVFGIGVKPTVSTGPILYTKGYIFIDNRNVQGAVYAISSDTNATLRGLEF